MTDSERWFRTLAKLVVGERDAHSVPHYNYDCDDEPVTPENCQRYVALQVSAAGHYSFEESSTIEELETSLTRLVQEEGAGWDVKAVWDLDGPTRLEYDVEVKVTVRQ